MDGEMLLIFFWVYYAFILAQMEQEQIFQLFILFKYTEVLIVGDFIRVHSFPVLLQHFLFSDSA